MQVDQNGVPRRNRVDLFTPAEAAIRQATLAVEDMAAHPLLTEAVDLLGRAKDLVADFVEMSHPEACPVPATEPAGPCQHLDFLADVTVNRLEDVGRFHADVRVKCVACQAPFRFIGLPAGLDLNGATVSVDGTEARLAIAPKGEALTPLESTAVRGFTVRKTQ